MVQDGRLMGVVTVRDIQAVKNSLWAFRRVADIMQTSNDEMVVSPDLSAMQALEQMLATGAERLVVVQDGQLLGLVTRASIGHFIEQRYPSGMSSSPS